MKKILLNSVLAGVLIFSLFSVGLCQEGKREAVEIKPSPEGKFVYEDDFTTQKYLEDAFISGNKKHLEWKEGLLSARGTKGKAWVYLTYFFTSQYELSDIKVKAYGFGDSNHVGGVGIELSKNGVNWENAVSHSVLNRSYRWLEIDTSSDPSYEGISEFGVRLGMSAVYWVEDCHCTSSGVKKLEINVDVGAKKKIGLKEEEKLFSQTKQKFLRDERYQKLLIDPVNPQNIELTNILEDDLILKPFQEEDLVGGLDVKEIGDKYYFRLHNHLWGPYASFFLLPASRLKCYLAIGRNKEPILIEIDYKAYLDGSPNAGILWDGEKIDEFSTQKYILSLEKKGIIIPAAKAIEGSHLLELSDIDKDTATENYVMIDAIKLYSLAKIELTAKPEKKEDISLKVVDSYFRPDPNPYEKEEEAGWYSKFGHFFVYLKNEGSFPVRIDEIYIGDKKIEDCFCKFGSDQVKVRKVVWYRINPSTIAPGEIGEVIIRFRRRPKKDFSELKFLSEGKVIAQTRVSASLPKIKIGYIAFNSGIDEIYLYAEKVKEEIKSVDKIYLDGKNLTFKAKIYPFFKNVSLIKIILDKPLEYGSYHTLSIEADTKNKTTVQFRAWDSFFSIGLWGTPGIFIENSEIHHANTYGTGHMPSLEQLDLMEKKGLKSLIPYGINTYRYLSHPAFFAYMLLDEVDARDDPTVMGGSLWIGRYAMLLEKYWLRFARKIDSKHFSHLVIDQCTTPYNWLIYGQLADILSTDPYTYTPPPVREITRIARLASSPKPFFITLKAFWAGKERPVSPGEERLMVYTAIGEGAKGIHYWVYLKSGGCMLASPPLAEEVGKINKELGIMAPLLSKGHPIENIVGCSNPKVWARSLLCGEENIVIVLVNEDYTSDKEGFSFNPLKKVKLEIEVPAWMKVTEINSIDSEGKEKINYKKGGDAKILLEIEEIGLTKALVLSSKN